MDRGIADRLTRVRKQNGLSQEELAEKLGVSRQAVSKWERAESSPDTDNLICLVRLYNISLDELLGMGNTGTPETPMSQAAPKFTAPYGPPIAPEPAAPPHTGKGRAIAAIAMGIFGGWIGLIFGIVALVYGFHAMTLWTAGRYALAEAKAKSARTLATIGLAISATLIALVIISTAAFLTGRSVVSNFVPNP